MRSCLDLAVQKSADRDMSPFVGLRLAGPPTPGPEGRWRVQHGSVPLGRVQLVTLQVTKAKGNSRHTVRQLHISITP